MATTGDLNLAVDMTDGSSQTPMPFGRRDI
jgi:hypothetical protein